MKFLSILFIALICSACAKNPIIKNIDNTSLNEKQSEIVAQEIVQLIKQNYKSKQYQNISLDTSTKNGQIIEQKLRIAGYAIEKANTKNHQIPILIYHIKQDNNKIFIHINFDNKMLNKAYILNSLSLVSTTPLTIIDLK